MNIQISEIELHMRKPLVIHFLYSMYCFLCSLNVECAKGVYCTLLLYSSGQNKKTILIFSYIRVNTLRRLIKLIDVKEVCILHIAYKNHNVSTPI